MPQFMCTMVAGLKEISKTEIEEKFSNAKNINTARGKVYFECKAKKNELLKLRGVDNIFYVLESFYIGPHKKDLEEFGKKIALLNYHNAISFLGISNVELLTTASKKEKQTYSRFDVADIALESIINKF